MLFNYFTAAKQQINEEFKKNKNVTDPVTVQNVCIQFILIKHHLLYYIFYQYNKVQIVFPRIYFIELSITSYYSRVPLIRTNYVSHV